MTKLLAQAINLQNELGLDDSKLRTIEQAMRSYAVDSINVAKILIEKRESPDNIRKFMEPHGITYSGVKKSFS